MSAEHDSPVPWIGADEPPPFELVNAEGRGRAILVCDHASARIPRRLGTLGLSPRDQARHVAWDIGAAAVARRLSGILDAPLALPGYSRLVVDCNRPLHEPDAFATQSEDVAIAGNLSASEQEKAERAEAFFWPYHDALHRLVETRTAGDAVPVMVSVHSFTPVYHGERRPWHIGVHYRWDNRGAEHALRLLREDAALHVGDNEPYPLALDEDYTVPVHAERRGMPYVLFEIRQDLIDSEAGADAWAERLGTLLGALLGEANLHRYGPAATDVREPRFEPP
jgi:predicted N-formylglutamate amidohydrolase